jgi:competence protein ComGC
LALLSGCGKQTVEAPDPAGAEAVAVKPAAGLPRVKQASDAGAADEAKLAAALSELTQLVRRYGMEQQSAPRSLRDLVSKGYLSEVPQAPPGKKYSINKNLQVYLADQ